MHKENVRQKQIKYECDPILKFK